MSNVIVVDINGRTNLLPRKQNCIKINTRLMIRDEQLKTVVAMNRIKGPYLQLASFHILLVALYHEM